MVRVEDRVWSAWQEAVDYNPGEPELLLLLSTNCDRATAVGAVRESVTEVWDVVQNAIWASGDPDRGAGEWRWLGVPGGVLVYVGECEVFAEMMRGVTEALERRSVDGIFKDARDWPRGVEAPTIADMLICRLRVRGRRRRFDLGYTWEPEPEAQAAMVAVAERWCKQLGERASYALTKSIGPVPVEFDQRAVEGLLEGPIDNVHSRFVGVGDDEYRQIGLGPVGGVGLLVGGAGIAEEGWRAALTDLTGVIRANAELIAYGYIRRGWSGGLFSDPSGADWPLRPDSEPRAAGWTSEAFQDVFAPDAFPIQLLGSGYSGRVPDARVYRLERIGDASVMLEHVDLPGWFDAPFVPYGQHPPSNEPPPAVLAEARRELAPILYTPRALSRAGYADLPDL